MCMPILNISFWNLSLLLHTAHLKKNIPALKAWYCDGEKKGEQQKTKPIIELLPISERQ